MNRVIEWSALIFSLLCAIGGDVHGVILGFMLAIYAKQYQAKGEDDGSR